MDIFAVESRGMYSPPNGASPQMIPDRWRNSPEDEIRTDLQELTDEELWALGWKGPVDDIEYDFYTQDKIWNTQTREWELIELDQFNKERRVNYQKFWDDLIDTSAYLTIKEIASQSLAANTLITEFVALLSDAKNGNANVSKIQERLLEIITNIPLNVEEFEEIQFAFNESGMYSVYTLNS